MPRITLNVRCFFPCSMCANVSNDAVGQKHFLDAQLLRTVAVDPRFLCIVFNIWSWCVACRIQHKLVGQDGDDNDDDDAVDNDDRLRCS